MPDIRIVSAIHSMQQIAVGRSIRELDRLIRMHGPGRWRKMKGIARICLPDGTVITAEVHWYEAHGVGRREFKVKRLLEATG